MDASFHTAEWHAARIAALTTERMSWEDWKKQQKEEAQTAEAMVRASTLLLLAACLWCLHAEAAHWSPDAESHPCIESGMHSRGAVTDVARAGT